MGFNRRETEGTFVWNDGSPWGFESWALASEPSGGAEECGMFYAVITWGMFDNRCSLTYESVCKAAPLEF